MIEINLEEFSVVHPNWIKKATVYEVHLRQYTKSGTIKEFTEHLPRLKEMGVAILWIMPVQPIGIKNRKGSMGSCYAIRDYISVNSDFGNIDDLKQLVNKAHEMSMFVILDWVANHTAWDHTWIEQDPDFYSKDDHGNIIHPPGTDWYDVAKLNFDNQKVWDEMIKSLQFWVNEVDIDGYRCDMAGLVPSDFWNRARHELDKIKSVFMLAEAEQIDHHHYAFDASYSWATHHLFNGIAKGHKSVWDLDEYLKNDSKTFPLNAIRMFFTSNHDENKNQGSAIERLGDAYEAFATLIFTLPGMPLIFGGQEAGLNRKLLFFDKDEIDWEKGIDYRNFYKKLMELKKGNKALWNGNEGGEMKKIQSSKNDKIFAFTRKKENNEIVAVFNLSPDIQKFNIELPPTQSSFKPCFNQNNILSNEMELQAWSYEVYLNNV